MNTLKKRFGCRKNQSTYLHLKGILKSRIKESILVQIMNYEFSPVIINVIMQMKLVKVSNNYLKSYSIIDGFGCFKENKKLSNC